MTDLTTIPFKRIDGTESTLEDFSGSVVLVVNVASQCGLTPQYEELEKLYDEFRGDGLVVLGFPANNFAGQEPGSNEEILDFCESKYGVEFPLAAKISVKGEDQHPLYSELTSSQPRATQNENSDLRALLSEKGLGPDKDNDVMWNFEKFLISREGQVVGRFAPDITPGDERIVHAIKGELAR